MKYALALLAFLAALNALCQTNAPMPPTNKGVYLGTTNFMVGPYSLQSVADGSTQAEAVADSQIVGVIGTNLYVGDSSYPKFLSTSNYTIELTPDGYAHAFPINPPPPLVWTSDFATWHVDTPQLCYGPWMPQQFFLQ